MTVLLSDGITFTATDLSRSYRQVLDHARRGSTVIRDTDGVTFLLAPVASIQLTQRLLDITRALLQVQHAIAVTWRPGEGKATADPAAFGELAWVWWLPDEDRQQFLHELADALLLASASETLDPIDELLYDWKATALSWRDADVRETLLADENEPVDIEL